MAYLGYKNKAFMNYKREQERIKIWKIKQKAEKARKLKRFRQWKTLSTTFIIYNENITNYDFNKSIIYPNIFSTLDILISNDINFIKNSYPQFSDNKYVDRIKIMLNDLAEKVKICHGDFNLDNIMVDEEDNLKLVDFGKGCFLDNDSKKNTDTDNFNNCNFYLDTISEQVTFDLQNYWYEIMEPSNLYEFYKY